MITITDKAAEELKKKTALGKDALGVRLSITETGCSGHSYKMEHVTEDNGQDDHFEQDGAVLFVPKTQLLFLMGTEVDYKEDKLQSGFIFRNPNADSACGCGESFSLKKDRS
jgi:iron-sulfur cluster assembly protein